MQVNHNAQKPSKLYSSPKCWHDISNTKYIIQILNFPIQFLMSFFQVRRKNIAFMGWIYHLYIRPSPIYPYPKLIYCLYIVHKSVSEVLVPSTLQKYSSYGVYCSLKIVNISPIYPSHQPIYCIYIRPTNRYITHISSQHHFWAPCTMTFPKI